MHDLFRTFEEKSRLIKILNECVHDAANYFGVQTVSVRLEKAVNAVNPNAPTAYEDADFVTGPILTVGSTAVWTYQLFNTGSVAVTVSSLRDDAGTPGNAGDDFTPAAVTTLFGGIALVLAALMLPRQRGRLRNAAVSTGAAYGIAAIAISPMLWSFFSASNHAPIYDFYPTIYATELANFAVPTALTKLGSGAFFPVTRPEYPLTGSKPKAHPGWVTTSIQCFST